MTIPTATDDVETEADEPGEGADAQSPPVPLPRNMDFIRLGIAIVRRPALDHVGDVDLGTSQPC